LNAKPNECHSKRNFIPAPVHLRWDHANIGGYYADTGVHLQPVLEAMHDLDAQHDSLSNDELHSRVEIIYSNVVNVLVSCANSHIPKHRTNFYKFWWNQELSILKENSIESDKLWKAAGKPRCGPLFDKRQNCRLQYRKCIREHERLSTTFYTNELHEALLRKNGPQFWKCWNSKFNNKTVCKQDDVIVDKFVEFFSSCYSCNNPQVANKLSAEFSKQRSEYHGSLLTDAYNVSSELISRVFNDLKRGKAAGLDSLTAEHLIFSHPALVSILVSLFNLMLRSSYLPASFGLSYTVPIPKISDCNTKALHTGDFRGIAISPILSKVFEYCLHDRFEGYFETIDNQFGFKKRVGCSHAIYTVRRTVEQFTERGSTVNLCTIDLTKAFDKTNHHALLMKLMQRKLPVEFLDLLIRWYGICWSCVKWNNNMSAFFKIDFGVRQGSVLSPYLFGIYLDDIVKQLSKAYRHVVIVLYADDILLLSPSVCDLQSLLLQCEAELHKLDMMINVKKSSCIRYGPRHDIHCAPITTANGQNIPWVTSMRYLGIYMIQSRTFKITLHNARRSFYRSCNAIFGKVGRTASEEVVIEIVNRKCLPVLLYGLEACPLSVADMKSLDFVVTRFLMKLFKTSNMSIINECLPMFGIILPSQIIQRRAARFKSNFHFINVL
jgi:hypothetical protein